MKSSRTVYSITEINRQARVALERAIGEVWVEGELSRVTLHSSGHWYFDVKDEKAAISCAMFSRDNVSVLFVPKQGMKVQMLVRPSLYEVTGQYQLVATKMEEVGKGNLQEQFEQLKAKLEAEGLFDQSRKQKLPLLPRKIGVVTSPTGAAIRDIIHVLTRRFSNIEILLIPAMVQGASAAKSIVGAITYLNKMEDTGDESDRPVDLIIVGRGGGSIEDLWCFNEEVVARAIAASTIPIISAVGHEIDFTISDFVADVRAPTPSAAAEIAVQEKAQLLETIALHDRRLRQSLKARAQDFRLRLDRMKYSHVFLEPSRLIHDYRNQIDGIEARMAELLKLAVQDRSQMIERSRVQMSHLLQSSVWQAHQRVDELDLVMKHRVETRLTAHQQVLTGLKSQLRMLNPLSVLGRGYSLTRNADGSVVRNASDLKAGDRIETQFVDGKISSSVEK